MVLGQNNDDKVNDCKPKVTLSDPDHMQCFCFNNSDKVKTHGIVSLEEGSFKSLYAFYRWSYSAMFFTFL